MITRRVLTTLAVAAWLLSPAATGSAAVKPAAKAPTAKASAAKVAAPTFTVLNPEAPLPEIDTKPLAPRLSTFEGKTIAIYDDHGGYEKPMAGLAEQLRKILPASAKIVYYEPKQGFKPADIVADAAIVGHGY
ncbi:MAG: hypothetical protein M0009_07130 [Deltaproteobacteria bacterium]|nr:hypothetical protein [Deltaproteobacteria bacterium]